MSALLRIVAMTLFMLPAVAFLVVGVLLLVLAFGRTGARDIIRNMASV